MSDDWMWSGGEDAWEHLFAAGRPGGDPLAALSDIGRLRRLLDEAELGAVREARRAGKSWAEIATKLGVTRQSAWERWRDLDVEPAEPAAEPEEHTQPVIERAARVARRQSWVEVPDVVGKSFDEAQVVLSGVGLVGVQADGDDPFVWPQSMVTDQSPESGARAQPGAPVRLWTERGDGGAGVREPRRPKPTPRAEHERLDEPAQDALG